MIAALFVQTGGAYFGLPGVDPWDEARDARNYQGPYPVVAHPPCSRWCKPLAKVNQTRYGHKIGDDGGCFDSALGDVLTFGGVLEHPANTYAWDAFEIPKPIRGAWANAFEWQDNVWVTEISQSAYGHPARKRTWLLYKGESYPPPLDWSDPKGTHLDLMAARHVSRRPAAVEKRSHQNTARVPGSADLARRLITCEELRMNIHGHKQVRIQVYAMVDTGVIEHVNRLNTMPGVLTHASCEGDEGYAPYVMVTWETDGARAAIVAEYDLTDEGDHWAYAHPRSSNAKEVDGG